MTIASELSTLLTTKGDIRDELERAGVFMPPLSFADYHSAINSIIKILKPTETTSLAEKSGNILFPDGAKTITKVSGLAPNVGVAVAGSNGGEFTIAADGAWTFDPSGDFSSLTGSDTAETSVTYHASDGASEAMGTLTVTVTSVNLSSAITQLAPTAYWKFDESSGLTAADEMGANTVTHLGSGIVVGDAPILADGKSIRYTGGTTSSRLSTNIIPPSGDTGPISFVFVFKNTSTKQAIFWDKLETTYTNRIFLAINRNHSGNGETGKICMFTYNDTLSSDVAMTVADARVNDGNAHILCIVLDASVVKIYIDGDDLPVSGSAMTGRLHSGTGHTLGNVLSGGSTLSCLMTMDDTAVFYNKALTALDVANLYAAFQV